MQARKKIGLNLHKKRKWPDNDLVQPLKKMIRVDLSKVLPRVGSYPAVELEHLLQASQCHFEMHSDCIRENGAAALTGGRDRGPFCCSSGFTFFSS